MISSSRRGWQWTAIAALGAVLVSGCATEVAGNAESVTEVAGPGSAPRGPGSPDPSLPHTEDPGRGGPGGEGSAPAPEDVSLDGVDPCVFTREDLDWFTGLDDGEVIEEREDRQSCRYQPVADEHPLIEVVLYTGEGLDEQEVDPERSGTVDINGRKTSVLEGLLPDGRLIVRMVMEMSDTSKAGLHYVAPEPESDAEAAQEAHKLKDLMRTLENRLTS